MASVCVLAPNGRRQTVKCSPNTTILQILEDVCKKQGLESEQYDLKHHNKILDTTATFRFSGLPNNAQLELVNAVKARADSEVTLALCLENGTRPVGNFKPSNSLLDVLKQLSPENAEPDMHPVIIYTRREIYGEDLETTTLKNLGLTGGRAMLRLINRSPEELKIQANVSAPLPAKPIPVIEKPFCRRVPQKLDDSSTSKTDLPTSDSTLVEEDANKSTNNDKPSGKPSNIQQKNNIDYMKLAKEKRKLEIKPTTEIEKKPKSKTDDKQSISTEESMAVDASTSNVKSNSFKEKSQINIDDFVFVGDRNAMIFSLESAQSVPSEDLPDDFFELTISDAQNILRDIKRKRTELEDGGPLVTAAYRNLEDSKKQLRQLSRYRKAIMRVQFPDRTILQGIFQPADTIEDVMAFVTEYLEEKDLDFYLYTAPPKCVLNRHSQLIEIDCVPGALVHFGTNSLDRSVQYLRQDLQDKFTTNSVASLAASAVRQQSRRPDSAKESNDSEAGEAMDVTPSTSHSAPTAGTSEEYTGRRIVSTTEKVPKWFKTSQK